MPKLEFSLVQYFPSAVSDEFINIGVVLVDSDNAGFVDVRFTQNWRSVQSFDPEADIAVLESFASEMRRTKDRPALLQTMEDSFSNAIRLSPEKGLPNRQSAGRDRDSDLTVSRQGSFGLDEPAGLGETA